MLNGSGEESHPSAAAVTIVICTRDRPDGVERTVRSVLQSSIDDLEVIVVDQSASGDDGPPPWLDDLRVRCVSSPTTGLSRARNIGLREAQADIVLMTDDDCTVDPHWARAMAEVFERHPTAAAVFGVVEAAPCDDAAGFVPAGPIRRSRLIRTVRTYDPGEGIGACSAFRRHAALSVGGFDVLLGAGAPLRSGEEVDMSLRLLLAGHHVAVSTGPKVTHHGFRTHEQARSLIRGYMLGSMACLAKLLRKRKHAVSLTLVRMVWVSLGPPIRSALAARQVPRIAGRISYMIRGFARGFRQPADPSTLTFR